MVSSPPRCWCPFLGASAMWFHPCQHIWCLLSEGDPIILSMSPLCTSGSLLGGINPPDSSPPGVGVPSWRRQPRGLIAAQTPGSLLGGADLSASPLPRPHVTCQRNPLTSLSFPGRTNPVTSSPTWTPRSLPARSDPAPRPHPHLLSLLGRKRHKLMGVGRGRKWGGEGSWRGRRWWDRRWWMGWGGVHGQQYSE